jgi:hypothetical protein
VRASACIVDVIDTFSNSSKPIPRDLIARFNSLTLQRINENARIDMPIRAFENFTPPVPFRRIARSLS